MADISSAGIELAMGETTSTSSTSRPAPIAIGWFIALLLALCFTLATGLQLWFQQWAGGRAASASVLNVLVGDSREMFAGYFFERADVYFHSGFYPSIFDQAQKNEKSEMTESQKEPSTGAGESQTAHKEHDDLPDFMKTPADWIDRMDRYFHPSAHLHLEKPGEAREILPWLRIAAELDPHRVQLYTTAAFWLRKNMGKDAEAEEFLREGWKTNPDSYEILFELGAIQEEFHKDPDRARNFFEAALRKWRSTEADKTEPDRFSLDRIVSRLALLEETTGRLPEALQYMTLWKSVSVSPEAVQARIDALKARIKEKGKF
jgi:tetratricopeptide (TPR) repeat protein